MAKSLNTAANVSVRQLLDVPTLATATLLAGEQGIDRLVTHSQLAPKGRAEFAIREGTALVIDGEKAIADTYWLDLALRWAFEAKAAVVFVSRPPLEIGLAPHRLAKRFGLPLVEIDMDALVLTDTLREIIGAPERNLAALVIDAVNGLSRVSARDGIGGILRVIEDVLDARSSLVGIEGGTVAGVPLKPTLAERDRIAVFSMSLLKNHARAVSPVFLALGEGPSFWVIAERSAPTLYWRNAAETILKLASQGLAVALMADRLTQERDARFRLGLLNAVISSENPERALVQQIGVLSWPIEGWCSAVHIQVSGDVDQLQVLAQTEDMRAALSACKLEGPLIERTDGWALWAFDTRETQADGFRELTHRVRTAMQNFVSGHGEVRISTGIGRPYYGLSGLRKSLAEANEAATIAQASGLRLAVQHIDDLGIKRILFGWYTSPEFADFAHTLLRPVLAIDHDGDLIRTLETYLDSESSPTLTADTLGVHRNTIMNRLARLREALTVDLEDADQRLAVQLACRVVNISGR